MERTREIYEIQLSLLNIANTVSMKNEDNKTNNADADLLQCSKITNSITLPPTTHAVPHLPAAHAAPNTGQNHLCRPIGPKKISISSNKVFSTLNFSAHVAVKFLIKDAVHEKNLKGNQLKKLIRHFFIVCSTKRKQII